MIQAQELRIGNLVQDKNGKIIKVDSVTETGINVSTFYNDLSHDYWHVIISGIPLSEEWMEKFGFEKFKYHYEISLMGLYGWAIGYNITSKKIHLVVGDTGKELAIQYVHQLQNLYFALTGEELTMQ